MGKPEPQDLPFTTPAGAFYCNNLLEFFEGLSEKDRVKYRGICVQNGYASIAVIPLNNRGKLTGAIHITDEKPGKVSPEVIEYIESIAPCIGEAVDKFRLEDELGKYRSHLEELVKERTVELEKANEELQCEIDGRIHAESDLRESEVRYKEVVDSLQEVIFEMDTRGVITFGNKRAYDFFGYTEEDYVNGISAVQALVPADRERALHNILNSLVGENVGINEYMAQRKDGRKFPIMVHSSPIIREGRPVG
ncbi:MAG: PAS domain S-box protein, partial [Desulfocucumaceae bacterium]